MSEEVWQLLLVEDDEDDYFIVYKMLAEARKGRFALEWASSYTGGLQALQAKSYDAILVDYDLGDETGERLIRDAIADGCQSPFLVLTGRGSYDIDVKAMQAGAADYLNKRELNSFFLERSIRYAVERKRTENELARSNAALHAAERRVRDILSGITDCYFLLDREWCFLDINANALTFLERTVDDLLGKVIWGAVPPLPGIEAEEKFRAVAQTGQPDHFELHFTNISRWADIHAYPVTEGIAVYFADITERKRSEQDTQFLAALGESLIAQDDPDLMIHSSLASISKYLHVDHCLLETVLPEQQTTTILAEYHSQDPALAWQQDRSDFRRIFYQLRQNGKALLVTDVAADPATIQLHEPVFQQLDVAAYLCIPRLVDGKWINTLAVATCEPRRWCEDEITLLRQTGDLVWLAVENARLLQTMKLTQERFDIALKNSEITVYTTDRDLRYTWLYRPMQPYLLDDVLGRRDDELPEARYLSELIQLKQRVLDSGFGLHKEIQLCIGEETVYLDLTIEPSRGSNGEVTGTIVSCINTTRFHQMEEQVQTSIAQVALQRQIMQSREEERKQISRDLHDGPIQNLIGLIFSIQFTLGMAQEEKLEEMLQNIQSDAQKLVGELRGVCNQLRPPILAQLGLAKSVRSFAEEFQEKHPYLTLHMDLCEDGQTLPETSRLALYRVFQEAMNNVVRHSRATEVKISYQLIDQKAVLIIEDNGEGVQTPIDWRNLARQGHLGLVGMKERVEALNGNLYFVSSNGRGTQLRAAIPY